MLRFGCLAECISFDLSANAVKMPGLGNNRCQILVTDLTSSIGGSATSWLGQLSITYIDSLGSHHCAIDYRGPLSTLENVILTHVGSVTDGGEGKERAFCKR